MSVPEKSSDLSKDVDDHIKRFARYSDSDLSDLREMSMISLLTKLSTHEMLAFNQDKRELKTKLLSSTFLSLSIHLTIVLFAIDVQQILL